MVLRLGTTAGRTGTGGHRLFAGSPGTQVVKIFDQAAARTGLRDHEAAAARSAPVTVASQADDHNPCYPGTHRITMRVTGYRGTGRLRGLQLSGHKNAETPSTSTSPPPPSSPTSPPPRSATWTCPAPRPWAAPRKRSR